MSPRVRHPQLVSFERYYIASCDCLCLSVAKQIQRRQCGCPAQRSSIRTPCHVASQTRTRGRMLVRLHSNHFSSPVLLTRRPWRHSRAWAALMYYSVVLGPAYGLSTELWPRNHDVSPGPAFRESHNADKDPPKLNVVVTSPTGVPRGRQSTASLGVNFPPTAFRSSEDVYRASIEDRRRILGHNIIPRHPNRTLL